MTATFELPAANVAVAPPEWRGLARDRVRLLVLDRRTGRTAHRRFDHIGEFLRPDDLLVFNASATLPAVLDATDPANGSRVEVRLAGHKPNGAWRALLVGGGPRPGARLEFGPGLAATVGARDEAPPRLWELRFSLRGAELLDRLHRLGRPVRYEYAGGEWPLADYQTVFARHPGSAEMPSAGRAFTWRLLFELRRRGVATASVVLHAGLSSYLDDAVDAAHPVAEEEYAVGPEVAAKIDAARRTGGRVIAVGTTVVRALESRADGRGGVRPGRGFTRLRIGPGYRLQLADGLLTGFHEPEASHLDMLAAFVPVAALEAAYAEAVADGYLWHEFGDLNLIC